MAGRCPTEEQYPLVFWAKKTNSFKPSAKKNLSVAYHPRFTVERERERERERVVMDIVVWPHKSLSRIDL